MDKYKYNSINMTPFKWFCLENFPFIEEDFDSLTSYGLWCKLKQYFDKVAHNVNEMGLEVQKLSAAFSELEKYVDNYFNNLDVQEEINNKLDEMATDGTLQEIISAYITSNALIVYNNINDLKNATNLIAGSKVKTLGYYSANDGGGSIYLIRNKTQQDIEDGGIIHFISNNLVAELIIDKEINPKQFGCYGDDLHDDTIQFEKCLKFATDNNYNVAISTGIYKITRQIQLKYYRYTDTYGNEIFPKKSIKIYGLGTMFSTKDETNSVIIKGYNIKDLSSILAFTGRGVNSATAVSLENICLELDNDSCDELSFCLLIGDANFVKISHCCFKGYNNVLQRCSSAPDDAIDNVLIKSNGYLFANVVYEQTRFDTNLYLDWDKTTIHQKNRFGFAIVDERVFVNNNANWKIYAEDSITYNNCLFRGAVFSYTYQALFNNCMWEFPTAYKPNIDISNDVRFNQDFLDNKIINCGVGLTILAGKVQLNSPYFEDCQRQINVRKVKSPYSRTIYSIVIINAHFNTSINGARGAIIDGEEIKAKYAINIEGINYTVTALKLIGCYFNNSNNFTDFQLKNTICRYISIENCFGIENSLINDTGSYRFHRSSRELDEIKMKFEVTMNENGGRLFNIVNSLAKCENIPNKKYLLQSAKIFVEGMLEEGVQLRVLKSDEIITSSNNLDYYKFLFGGDYENKYNSLITDNSTYELFNYDTIPRK